ncbi:MAG: polyprenyl synthetase family protein [Pirellulales bacterium]|nr:polyprenyl synthetase family protein [Pirellulales bacterium]
MVPTSTEAGAASAGNRQRRRKTSHLKTVPPTRQLRDQIRQRCQSLAAALDKSSPLSKEKLEELARQILSELSQPEGYVGWTMVLLSSEFWREQVAATPYSRRLLLLPHCLKHAEGCPADYDEFGLDCRQCGACSIADFRARAEDLGYKVLVAEGSPIVLKIIIGGYVDAILGVACLNVLEKAIDKILLAGIPCMAVPLHSSDCRNTSVDEDWVSEMIHIEQQTKPVQTRSYVHLMRAAGDLFKAEQLERLAPRLRDGKTANDQSKPQVDESDPIACTEAIAHDFLARGGKHSRPFITLATYDAMRGGEATLADGATHCEAFPDEVRRTALSIETFHKASLVHDDIEDEDMFRYGSETLHRQYGTATAINVGDYLIGLGYRLVSRDAVSFGHQVAAELTEVLSEAHMRLSEGQGAELMWRERRQRHLQPLDALKIYALKTAPAFEAALLSGLRLAGPIDTYRKPIRQFARHLGVAFQILNDLKDWSGDEDNKLASQTDVLGGRPTVLWALALESLGDEEQAELFRFLDEDPTQEKLLLRIGELYRKTEVFEKAARLIDKYQQRAEEIADQMEVENFRKLLYYLIDTVLDRGDMPNFDPDLVQLRADVSS